MPKSLLGKYALGLLIIFLLCLILLILQFNTGITLLVSLPDMTFGVPVVITGIATFITGLISLKKYKDRSPVIILTIIFGAIVVLSTVLVILKEVIDLIGLY